MSANRIVERRKIMIVTEARGAIPTDCLFWRNMKWELQFGLRKNKKDGVCE